MVRSLSDGKDMRRNFAASLRPVDSNSPHGVDGEPLIRVDCDTEESRVGIDEVLNVSLL